MGILNKLVLQVTWQKMFEKEIKIVFKLSKLQERNSY